MPALIDPSDSLTSFQEALSNNLISPSSCVVHPLMKVLLDDANGTPRITYALIEGLVVKAVAVYVPVEPFEGKPAFGVGYAVDEQYRKQGVATKLLKESIEEMQVGFNKSFPAFYVEAIVGVGNLASNKLASKLISSAPESGNDSYSGEPINQYIRLVETTSLN